MNDPKRLGGGKRDPIVPYHGTIDHLEIWRLPGMLAALSAPDRTLWVFKYQRGKKFDRYKSIGSRPLTGDPARLSQAIARSDQLIEDAIAHDPRLGRRGAWERAEEGEFACPALLAAGDDTPCFRRVRRNFTDRPGYEDQAIRIVISTDSNEVKPDTAAAFIATARLVQQFRPLEIWWQGAWLDESKCRGFVFHVPLITGDMDFSRLEFVINDRQRDTLSYCVMVSRSIDLRQVWNGCKYQATDSYLEDTSRFIDHEGIQPDGEYVAGHAARWLGWDSVWRVQRIQENDACAALQTLPPLLAPPNPPGPQRTAAENQREEERNRRLTEQWRKEREKRDRDAANRREKDASA